MKNLFFTIDFSTTVIKLLVIIVKNPVFFIFTFMIGTTLFFYICLKSRINDEENVPKWKPRRMKSCHLSRKRNALPTLVGNESFPVKSIFFQETTCRGDLTSRQACAVEAAARAHPGHQINVFFTSPVAKDALQDGSLAILQNQYKNVKLLRVNIVDYSNNTPMTGLVRTLHDDSERLDMHIEKIMKYLTVFKYSGIHLNLDVIVARPLSELWKNWAVRDSTASISAAMFSFSDNTVGRKLAKLALGFVQTEMFIYKGPDTWSFSSPNAISHVSKLWCYSNTIGGMSLSNCNDLAVYGPDLFYTISFYERQAYFRPVDWETWKEKQIYTYHVWEKFTKFGIITPNSLYYKIAMNYCPEIYKRFANYGLGYPYD